MILSNKNFLGDENCVRLLVHMDLGLLKANSVLYSLIDGAKFPEFSRIALPTDGSVETYTLINGNVQRDAFDAGANLLRHNNGYLCPVFRNLLSMPGSANFLSLIVSDQPMPLILRRLTWLTDVLHEDTTEWIMRYYDPVILPHWLDVLDVLQQEIALTGTQQWLYIDAKGQPIDRRYNCNALYNELPSKPMILKENQCEQLMEATLPYLIMHELVSDNQKVLDAISPPQRYDFFMQQLRNARSYSLTSITDLKTYCLLSLMFGSGFDSKLLILSALNDASPVLFSDKVLTWTPEEWAALE